jgi:hypothetical protein
MRCKRHYELMNEVFMYATFVSVHDIPQEAEHQMCVAGSKPYRRYRTDRISRIESSCARGNAFWGLGRCVRPWSGLGDVLMESVSAAEP